GAVSGRARDRGRLSPWGDPARRVARWNRGAPGVRLLIVNADDFGLSRGVNEGIIEAHTGGILTSTSLMVWRPGAEHAAKVAAAHPALSVGLHFDDGCGADLDDLAQVSAA